MTDRKVVEMSIGDAVTKDHGGPVVWLYNGQRRRLEDHWVVATKADGSYGSSAVVHWIDEETGHKDVSTIQPGSAIIYVEIPDDAPDIRHPGQAPIPPRTRRDRRHR